MTKQDTPREKRALPEAFERVWSQALLAVSAAEEEAQRVAQRVAALAGWGPEEVRRQARELTARLANQRHDLERTVEDGVRRTLSRMRVPRREELQDLTARLDRVAARLEALAQERRS